MKTKCKRLIAVLALLWTGNATAQPAYFKVTEALDDHLNVRAEPTATSNDIGNIKPGAQPFEILETDSSGQWGKILWLDRTAWVALKYMEPIQLPMLQNTSVPIGLICAGTEPFWTIEVESAEASLFSTPEADIPMSIANVDVSKNTAEYPVAIEMRTENFAALTVVRRQACSDGMSDTNYNWAVDVVLQPDLSLLSGCCVKR